MIDPQWSAELLQVALGASLAFAAAVVILRKQLQHDRNLARDQRLEDIALAAAQRRADVAGVLGRRVIVSANQLDYLDDGALTAAVRSRDIGSWITEEIMPGLDEARDISREVSLVFAIPMSEQPFWQVWLRRLHEWEVFRKVLLSLDASGEFGSTRGGAFEHAFYDSVDERMVASTSLLNEIGESWVRWNGLEQLPSGQDRLVESDFDRWPGLTGHARWFANERNSFISSLRSRLDAAEGCVGDDRT